MPGGNLAFGDTGDGVRRWQTYLQSQGFKVAAVGRFGPATLAATRQMQRRLGVNVDGIVGPQTTAREGATGAQPMPPARPPMVMGGDASAMGAPAAPMGQAGGQTSQPFVSSDKEWDPASAMAARINNQWDQTQSQDSMGQYYQARMADALQNPPAGAPPPAADVISGQAAGQAGGSAAPPMGAAGGDASPPETGIRGLWDDWKSGIRHAGNAVFDPQTGALGRASHAINRGLGMEAQASPASHDATIRALMQSEMPNANAPPQTRDQMIRALLMQAGGQ